MANIKISLDYPIYDGMTVTFKAPCDCTVPEGLKICFPGGEQIFKLKDAHDKIITGDNLGNVFVTGAYVTVILDITNCSAYVQNADNNSYIRDLIKPGISEKSVVTGNDSSAGVRGFLIDQIDFENKHIYLSGSNDSSAAEIKFINGYGWYDVYFIKGTPPESPVTFKLYAGDDVDSLTLYISNDNFVVGESGDLPTRDHEFCDVVKIELDGVVYWQYKHEVESDEHDWHYYIYAATEGAIDETFGGLVGLETAQFSIINGYHYPFCGRIVDINHNKITYEGDLGFTELVDTDSARKYGHLFYVPGNPQCGSVDIGVGAFAFGIQNYASAKGAFVAGRNNVVGGNYGAGFGRDNKVGYAGLVSGASNEQTNIAGTCFGVENENHGYISHVRGRYNVVPKGTRYAVIDGVSNTVGGEYNSAKGYNNTISAGKVNQVGGTLNKVHDGNYNDVSGRSNEVTGSDNHVEGHDHTVVAPTVSSGRNHVEGYLNKVYSKNSHIQGIANEAQKLDDDGTEVTNIDLTGYHNIGNGSHQTVAGKYNSPKSNMARITGGGTSNSKRKNIEELDWLGNLWVRGDVRVGGNSPDEGRLLAELADVGAKVMRGTYTGANLYGSNNPNKLTFDFDPWIVIVSGTGATSNETYVCPHRMIWVKGQNSPNIGFSYVGYKFNAINMNCSYDEASHSLTWSNGTSAAIQLNENRTYTYIAIGMVQK